MTPSRSIDQYRFGYRSFRKIHSRKPRQCRSHMLYHRTLRAYKYWIQQKIVPYHCPKKGNVHQRQHAILLYHWFWNQILICYDIIITVYIFLFYLIDRLFKYTKYSFSYPCRQWTTLRIVLASRMEPPQMWMYALSGERPRRCNETWNGKEYGWTSVPSTSLLSKIVQKFPFSKAERGKRGRNNRGIGFAAA